MNSEKLNELLRLAQGSRSQNTFASHCGIDSSTLTKIIRNGQVPTPKILKKISSKANNGVTYYELMQAAGHLGILESELKKEVNLIDVAKNYSDDIYKLLLGYMKLTEAGQSKLLEHLEILSKIKEYEK